MVYTLVQGRDRHTSAVGGERGHAEVEFWVRSFSLERWSTCTGVICISPFPNKPRVRIHHPFSRTFFVFVSKICKFECNTTSDWLNRTV